MQSILRASGSKTGFTMVELMIVVALFIIVVAFIFSLFLVTIRTAAAQDAMIGMRDEARLTAEKTAQLIRGARQIAGVDTGGTIIAIGALNTPAAQVTFTYPEDQDGDFVISDTTEYTGAMTLGLDINDANGDGLTTTQIILLDDDGDVLNVLSNRAVPLANNALGGFVLQNIGGGNFQIDVNLQTAIAGNQTVSVTETRVFELKNV